VKLEKVFREYNPEVVFHLAAQPLVRFSYQEPRMTYETNIMGTVNILEVVRNVESVRSCVIVTSDKCYNNSEWVYAYRENDSLGGYDPYSSSKACAELVVTAYRNSFGNDNSGLAMSSVRAGNVIGGGDWALDRIVPDTINALVQGKPVSVRSPHAIRPWQHVLEPLSGYLWLTTMMLRYGERYSSAWNFGPNSTGNVTVRDLVEKIIDRWGTGSWLDLSEGCRNEPHEANFLKLDCTKANNLLHWYPVYDISEALDATVGWYRQYYTNSSTGSFLFTLQQIEAYIEKAWQSGAVWA